MDISGEVANIHMRTDAKNLVNTARTIQLPENETIHMISMLRKEACSVSIHDLARIPTPNCLADCLTKASGKANNLITAVKTGRFLDVHIHPDFRTLLEHKGGGSFLPEHSQNLSCTNPQKGPFQVVFVGTQQTREQKELNTREREGQDATKITVAFIQFLWSLMPILMTTPTRMVRNIPNRNTIEEFTEDVDEAEIVRQCNFFHLLMRMWRLCLALMNLLLSVAPPSSSLVTMAVSIPHWVVKSDRLSPDEDQAVSTEDMVTSTASALAVLKHHSLRLLREYHVISCLTMPISDSSEG